MIDDDDLSVSIFIRRNTSRSANGSSSKGCQPVRKEMSSRGHPKRPKRGPEQSQERNWSTTGPRTLLSCLIHSGVVSPNEGIHLWSPKDDVDPKEGLVTRDGLLCIFCHEMLSISGKPLALSQLEARKAVVRISQVNDGDDLCGICGLEGELVCCDNCPATFHQAMLV